MNTTYHSKEHQILATIRQVLSAVARDTAPTPGRQHALTPQTIADLKQCFLLITAREKEIIEAADGDAMDARPHYADATKTSQIVQLTRTDNKD